MPKFQGQHHSTLEAAARAQNARPGLAEVHMQAVDAARAQYEAERAARSPVLQAAK